MDKENKLPLWDELPTFEIYLDQLLDLANNYVYPITGEHLTRTMMHNYTKAEVIVRPRNKRYLKIHLAGAIVVSLLKSVFSLDTIKNGFQIEMEQDSAQEAYDRFVNMFNQVSKTSDSEYSGSENPNSQAAMIQYQAILSVTYHLRAIATMRKILLQTLTTPISDVKKTKKTPLLKVFRISFNNFAARVKLFEKTGSEIAKN